MISMPTASGRPYVDDLARLRLGEGVTALDLARADALCDYLVAIHSVRRDEPDLYRQRVRETIGHVGGVMDLVDGYPDRAGCISRYRLRRIEEACLSWRWRVRTRTYRLRQVHGAFDPDHIRFDEGTALSGLARPPRWGEPADDVACLTTSILFHSLQGGGHAGRALETLFERFWARYLQRSGDDEMPAVAPLFFARHGLALANPRLDADLSDSHRDRMLSFVEGVLTVDRFDPRRVREYCEPPRTAYP
jgi:hypothetical protein